MNSQILHAILKNDNPEALISHIRSVYSKLDHIAKEIIRDTVEEDTIGVLLSHDQLRMMETCPKIDYDIYLKQGYITTTLLSETLEIPTRYISAFMRSKGIHTNLKRLQSHRRYVYTYVSVNKRDR